MEVIMPRIIKESELAIPALRAASRRKNGHISTSDLIKELGAELEPEGHDAEILEGRQDTHFSQKVRNLISHRTGASSMFSKGYAIYNQDGIEITDAGKAFLAQVPTE